MCIQSLHEFFRTATSASQAPFMAEVELCGSVLPADPHWRCYNEPPVDWEAWLLPTFEDERWRPAVWAPRSLEASSSSPSSLATVRARAHFSRDTRFVLPAPTLDEQAEDAWRAWTATKAEANDAFRAWRAAKENQTARVSGRMENDTLGQPQYSTSMRGAGVGAAGNRSASLVEWKDHAPNATIERLEWHKPRTVRLHGYFCRLAFPNPHASTKAGAPV